MGKGEGKGKGESGSWIGRYYVLIVFSLISVHQNTTGITFGTIPGESYDAFGFSDDVVTILAGQYYIVALIL